MRIKEDKQEQERVAKKLRDEASNDTSDAVAGGEASQESAEAPQEPRPEVGSIEVYFPRETKLLTNQPRQTRQVCVCVDPGEAGDFLIAYSLANEQEKKKQRTRFTEFVLFKENKDTTDVVNVLSGSFPFLSFPFPIPIPPKPKQQTKVSSIAVAATSLSPEQKIKEE